MVMSKVNIHEVKAKLSEYLDRAAQGERILICRHNEPIAELRAVESARIEPRPVGPLPGRVAFEVPASFFEPLSDAELDLWDGGATADPVLAERSGPAGRGTKVAEATPKYGKSRSRRPARRRS
jgi:prevent-host-death family protein